MKSRKDRMPDLLIPYIAAIGGGIIVVVDAVRLVLNNLPGVGG